MDFKLKYFSNNGLIVHHANPENGNFAQQSPYSGLGERRPVIYRPDTRDVFVGEPGWYHGDTYRHFDIPDMYADDYQRTHEGFFAGNEDWGNGGLSWYSRPSDEEHEAVKEALLNAGHEITDPEPEPVRDEEDWDF